MTENNYIIGTCKELCPQKEIKLRKSRNLIHYYEKNGKFVKEFTRSAADRKMEQPENLRTFDALKNTLEYLFNTIFVDREKPLNYRYDFIFDRCRAVRQEIVMQNFTNVKTVELLEPIVMFLSYCLYRLNNLPISLFDTKICKQHLHECLLKCLSCYEEIDEMNVGNSYKMENRIIIEAIQLMLNIDDFNTIQRAIKLDSAIKSSFTLRTAIKISINFHRQNYHKVLHDIQELPHLVGAIASLNLSQIRKEIFRIFTIAYSSQVLKVPLEFIQRLLIYDEQSNLFKHLSDLGIHENSNEKEIAIGINFNRKKFDNSKSISNTQQHFVDNKLDDFHLPDLILMKTCIT